MKHVDAIRFLDRFAKAVEEKAFLGTIPVYHHDPEEQRAIDRERARIEMNFTRSYNALIKALEVGE